MTAATGGPAPKFTGPSAPNVSGNNLTRVTMTVLRTKRWASALLLAASVGCGSSSGGDLGGGDNPEVTAPVNNPQVQEQAGTCSVNYPAAQRTVALALAGTAPPWTLLEQMMNAADDDARQVAYQHTVEWALGSKEFAIEQVRFFRNMFATGPMPMRRRNNDDGQMQYVPNMDCAANFAAEVVVKERPYTELFTATAGTCPVLDEITGAFTAGDVLTEDGSALGVTGILNDPGLMSNHYSNMAFRRVRFLQETFACSKFPAESNGPQIPMGSALYTSPWSFNSITGGTKARVDFQDTSAVICANCHSTMNHLAPLFLNFDQRTGLQRDNIQVRVPVEGMPTAQLADFLPEGERTSWRLDKPVNDIPELGQAMAQDPEVARCIVNRVWNHALSRGDIVRDLATIPTEVTEAFVKDFTANNYNVKKLIHDVYTSPEYVAR